MQKAIYRWWKQGQATKEEFKSIVQVMQAWCQESQSSAQIETYKGH